MKVKSHDCVWQCANLGRVRIDRRRPLEAQLLFGSRLGQAHYEGDDTKIIMRVGADMLRNAPDGESRPWSNPQTGHSGTITILRSYKRGACPAATLR